MDTWGRVGSSEINPHIYGPLGFDQGVKTFEQMVPGQLDIGMEKDQVGPLPHTIYKNELKMHQL